MSEVSPLDLLEAICMKKWEKARELIEEGAVSIYAVSGSNNRLVIHELCKLISLTSTPQNGDEISDDEDEDEEAPRGRTLGCFDCVKEDNMIICELAMLMIDMSHKLGPVRVTFPPPANTETGQSVQNEEEHVEVHESILTVKDSLEKTPLHVLCENSAETNMLGVILRSTREHNKYPSAPTALSLITAQDSRGSTPLHYLAYSRQCPLSSLELMMDYCKLSDEGGTDPTTCTDVEGDTPLHWALDGYMSPRRIKQLIRHSKEALRVKNQAGKQPFDQFVGNFVDTDWKEHELCGQEVWENIQEYLKVVADEEEQCGDWLPVHMLAGSSINFPSEFIEIALHFNKEDLSKPDSRGLFPLHLACSRKGPQDSDPCDDSIATKMLRLYPQAAYKAATETKRLPIHIALEAQKPLPLIAALLQAYPNSLNIKDPVTGLWPFLLASVDNDESLDTSYSLLRADPSIVQVAIRALISKSGQRAAQARQWMGAIQVEGHSSRRMRRFVISDDY